MGAAPLVAALSAHRAERLGPCAMDLHVRGVREDVRAKALALADEAGLDAFVQPAEGRRKHLLMADMDSTMIEQECIDELAAVRGLRAEVAAITDRAMRGELDFAAALTERVALLKGVPAAAIDELLAGTITASRGAATLVAGAKAHGMRTVLVSGGFLQFAEPVAARLGMDRAYANRLVVEDGLLTGEVEHPILGADAKRDRLLAECEALGIAPTDAIAIGDGANDYAMVTAAGLGIAHRAKPVLREVADGVVRHGDLTSVLLAMGIVPDDRRDPSCPEPSPNLVGAAAPI